MSADDSLSELIGRTHGRPVYLASAFAVAPRFIDDVADLLRQKQPGAVVVNSRGRYRGSSDWHKRWRQERNRYGGAIIMTVAEPFVDDTEPPTGAGIPGAHVVGESVALLCAVVCRRRF